jgi:predicted Zn-dependent protease
MTGSRVLAALLAVGVAAPSARAAGKADDRQALLEAMQAELARTQQKLKLESYDAPYFVGFRMSDERNVHVAARFGALVDRDDDHHRQVSVDVRVGDYTFDSSPDPDDGYFDEGEGFHPSTDAPVDDDPAVVRATFWLLTDDAYKKALQSFLRKRAKRVSEVEDKHVDSFTREPAASYMDPPQAIEADPDTWASLARRLSAKFKDEPGILDGSIRISADKQRMFLVNSEGSRIVRESVIYSVAVEGLARADDGMLLEQGKTFYGRKWGDLPTEKALEQEVDTAIKNLRALRAAPVADPYAGPAILEPEATGVFFHETVGHRLEGDRQQDENEGRTFKGQVGKAVLPSFITVRDDPTTARAGGLPLNGFYPYDDQGVKSRDTVLIDHGVLKTFLTGRNPVEGVEHSNGHGRAQNTQRAMARMGNLIVESDNKVPRAKLKELLLEEVRKQGKPYGLIITDIIGGSTNTSTYGFQAFKGVPRMVYRVDAKTGKEELVRGVEIVGTPLSAVNKIVATSDEVGVFNGYCGAESGYVPVSTVAPASLFREMELQRTQRDKERTPVLPAPWAAPEGAAKR